MGAAINNVLTFYRKIGTAANKKVTKKYLTPIVVKYDVAEQPTINSKSRLNIISEIFAEDFREVINLVKNIKLPLIKEKGIPSKNSIIKMNSVLINKELLFKNIGGIDRIWSIEDTNRIYGIFMILAESGLIYENGNIMCVSDKVEAFIDFKLEL